MSKTTVRDVDMEPEPSASQQRAAATPRTEGASRAFALLLVITGAAKACSPPG